MKNPLYSLFIAVILSACISESTPDEPIQEVDKTDDTIMVLRNMGNSSEELNKLNFLGYGYDASAEYADLSAVRGQIFDLEKLDSLQPGSVINNNIIDIFTVGVETISPNRDGYLSFLGDKKRVKGRPFKRTIASYFITDYEEKDDYVYARYVWEDIYTYDTFITFFEGLSEEFTFDVEVLDPESLIEKYGTHIIKNAYYGHSLTVLYRAKTQNIDRVDAAISGITIAMDKVFGRYEDDINNTSIKGNYSQMLGYKVMGGDTEKLIQYLPTAKDYTQIDATEWQASLSENNRVFVDMSFYPMYYMIQDEVKAEAVKNYIEAYLK